MTWVTGYNMPGYMPDNDNHHCEDWGEAINVLSGNIELAMDDAEQEEYNALSNALTEILSLTENSEYGNTIGRFHYWLTRS